MAGTLCERCRQFYSFDEIEQTAASGIYGALCTTCTAEERATHAQEGDTVQGATDYTAFDALFGGAVVVAVDEDYRALIVWNGSSTFNWWVINDRGGWENTDCFTVYGEGNPGGACTLEEALRAGREAMREELESVGA